MLRNYVSPTPTSPWLRTTHCIHVAAPHPVQSEICNQRTYNTCQCMQFNGLYPSEVQESMLTWSQNFLRVHSAARTGTIPNVWLCQQVPKEVYTIPRTINMIPNAQAIDTEYSGLWTLREFGSNSFSQALKGPRKGREMPFLSLLRYSEDVLLREVLGSLKKGSFKGDIDIDIGIDVDTDIALDARGT